MDGARLELVNPSDDLRITARYDPGLDLSWEEQLQAWFERFPPGGDGPQEIDLPSRLREKRAHVRE